jgi:hypothetical protein
MPKIAEQLERLNDNVEALLAELRKRGGAPKDAEGLPPDKAK